MAFCKYCGKNLSDGEVCTCPEAVANALPVEPAAPEVNQEEQPTVETEVEQKATQQTPPTQPFTPPVPPVAPPFQPAHQFAPQMVAPKTTKPRSAYVAALLHLFFGLFGLGYYYRGMKDKARNCWIMLIVGAATSVIFGLGVIVLAVCEIINFVQAIKLFNGDYPVDAYGRELLQEF